MSATQDANVNPPESVLETDVCIVGAGAAGLTLAHALMGSGLRILLLEGGAGAISGESQELYRAEQTGLDYFDLASCRLRYLGGTTNHWGGYCRENDPIDYEPRPDLGFPGWPVSYQEIRPYVVMAAKRLGLDSRDFDAKVFLKRHVGVGRLIEELTDQFETKVFLLSRQLRFKDIYRAALEADPHCRLMLNANVTHVALDPGGARVDHLDVCNHAGKKFSVRARVHVLAAHAVENSRLLLVSDDVHKSGVGNDAGHVGRYFMEHPHVNAGLFFPKPEFPAHYSLDTLRRLGLNANVSLSRSAMLKHGVLQYYCRFVPIHDFDRTANALRRVVDGFWHPLDLRMLRALNRVTQRPLESMRAGAYYKTSYQPTPVAYSLDHRIEQAPNADSQVSLTDERDRLGVRKVRLHWQLNELDYKTFEIGQRLVASEMTRLGLGVVKAEPLTRPLVDAGVEGHYHHIGTTRMSRSSNDGVVDAHGRVHEVDNLFVTGSSVFPTSGYSGPTMMVVAFALRLADRLRQVLPPR